MIILFSFLRYKAKNENYMLFWHIKQPKLTDHPKLDMFLCISVSEKVILSINHTNHKPQKCISFLPYHLVCHHVFLFHNIWKMCYLLSKPTATDLVSYHYFPKSVVDRYQCDSSRPGRLQQGRLLGGSLDL